MLDEILETWRVNNRVNLLLIENISDEGMQCTLSQRGGRNVVRQFAHLHNNRIRHVTERAKALAEGARLFETNDEPDRRALLAALRDSADRVERMFSGAHDGVAGIRPFKRGVIAYLGYFIAHESHHRGNILLTLKQCGHRLDKKVQYAIWDWARI